MIYFKLLALLVKVLDFHGTKDIRSADMPLGSSILTARKVAVAGEEP